jgi:hypothetical protein
LVTDIVYDIISSVKIRTITKCQTFTTNYLSKPRLKKFTMQLPSRRDYGRGGHPQRAKPERDSVARFAFGEEYFKLRSPTQIKWICVAGAEEWIGTTISFELRPDEKGTLVKLHLELKDQIQQQGNFGQATQPIFHHDGWKEYTPMFAECNYTWAQLLRSLKLLCETGKGHPWPDQHRTEFLEEPRLENP